MGIDGEASATSGAHNNDDSSENDTSADAALGGAMRSALRTAIMRFRIQNPIVGSFPRTPVPTRAVVAASDNLSFLMDISGYIKEAQGQISENSTNKAKASKLVKWATTTWVPNLIRSSALGSVTWTSYELTSGSLNKYAPTSELHTMLPWAFGVSVVAGSVAGSLHGSLWGLSEKAITTVKHEPFHYRLPGVIFSHSVSHLAMFASYESAKVLLLNQVDGDHTQVEGAFCILGAATISGLVGEVVTHLIAPFESEPFAKAFKQANIQSLPSLRSMAPSAFSTMLGWLAYEYAKETLEGPTE